MVPIKGFEGRYSASKDGRVFSHKASRFLRPGTTSKGYQTVCLYDGSSPKKPISVTVHSVVAASFIGARPEGLEINHKDLDKRNNSVDNLEYVTPKQNSRHAYENGAVKVPEPARKLSHDAVRAIRRSGDRHVTLADAYGVSESTIRNVRTGRCYGKVEE
jgi:hypothetical protein